MTNERTYFANFFAFLYVVPQHEKRKRSLVNRPVPVIAVSIGSPDTCDNTRYGIVKDEPSGACVGKMPFVLSERVDGVPRKLCIPASAAKTFCKASIITVA